jgi:hypothetical protein
MSIPYQTEVLADTPAKYHRLDMVGAASNGDVIPDLSGNDLDAELVFTGQTPAPFEPYGYASPVETDPSSREFWGYTDASIYGMPLNGVSRIRSSTDALIEPSGDHANRRFLSSDG